MASWPVRRNWSKSRVREKTTIAASRIAKHERHPAHRRPEREIEGRPEQRDRQDQHRDQHEERLAGARVVVVLRIRADPRQTRQHRSPTLRIRLNPAQIETVLARPFVL